jgi:hypothetical protein
VRLSTVKVYTKLATKAGSLALEEYALIKLVTGYRHAEGKRIDRRRERTRKSTKKGTPTSISTAQAAQLKAHADQGATGRRRLELAKHAAALCGVGRDRQ